MSAATQWELSKGSVRFSTGIHEEGSLAGCVAARMHVGTESITVIGTPEALQEWLDELVAVTQPTIEEAKARAAEREVRA